MPPGQSHRAVPAGEHQAMTGGILGFVAGQFER